VIKFVSDLQQVGGFPSSIKLTATTRYNWYIVESGVKQYEPNPNHRAIL
jgi:hypothetical protein